MRPRQLSLLPLILLLLSVATLEGCTGTRAAYNAAQTPDQYAYVVTEHYAALVKEAADRKAAGTLTGSALASVQAADNAARPLVLQLGELASAYSETKSAEDAAALQLALNKAVLAVSQFITTLKGTRS